jgi:hypothetical protein
MNKFIKGVTIIFCLSILSSFAFAQDFPPTYNGGPFPTGTETARNDAPVDLNVPDAGGTLHEYTVYRGTPLVDGEVDNDDVWKQIPWTAMDSYDQGGSTCYIFDDACDDVAGYDGWEDITAWFKILWDDDHIYFALKKIDNENVFNEAHYTSLGDIWQDDAYQFVINTNDPLDNDGSGVSTEIGVALFNGADAAYNNWFEPALELADGAGVSEIEICDGKAIIGSMVQSDNYYTEIIEMAFVKWDEVVADEAQMFSIMCNDPDEDHTVHALQWTHGIFNPKNPEFFASILYSSSEAPAASAVVDNNPSGLPTEFSLQQNYPNPFNPSTVIPFSIPKSTHITLSIYDMLGQRVKMLIGQTMGAGTHSAVWDGTNEFGETVTNGIYFYKLRSNLGVQTKKMMFMK